MRTPIVGLGHTISVFFFLLFIGLFFNSCKKDTLIYQSLEVDTTDILLRNSEILDTSLWQLDYMYNHLSNQYQEGLHEFLFKYGQPQWYSSFQKRSNDKTVTITTVPFMRNDSLSGVLKMYDANNDSLDVSFFSIDTLNNALLLDEAGNLNTTEYHMYRGAVQSLVLAANVLNISIDSKYLEWLKNTTDRISTRSIFTCVYDIECHLLMSFSSPENTGWIEKYLEFSLDTNSITFRSIEVCDVVLVECFEEFGFSGFYYGSHAGGYNSTVDWSINHWLNGSTTNNSSNNNTVYHRNKSSFLEDWLRDEGLSEGYLDLIYDCAEGIPHPLNPNLSHFVMNESCLNEKLECYEYDIDLYGNSGISSFEECVKEQAIKNSECFPQLKQFMISYGLTQTLSLDEKYALVGPEGVGDCNNFDEEAIIVLLSFTEVFNLDDDQNYKGLNDCEKELVKIYPSCALKIKDNYSAAIAMTLLKFGANGRNDCSDAFRHAFFNALNTYSCGILKAEQFGNAHECDVSAAYLSEKEMDLHNNEIGRNLANSNPNLTQADLANIVCQEITIGNLVILDDINNGNSNLIDSDGCICQ